MEPDVYERWLAKVRIPDEDGCWIWAASDNGKGYGRLRMPDGLLAYAHRLAYEHFVGPIPAGQLVRHTCDQPRCVNPEHLLVGTHSDNRGDMKEEMLRGLRRRYKLMVDDVLAIRADQRSCAVVARELGVSKSTISLVRKRKTWQFVQ